MSAAAPAAFPSPGALDIELCGQRARLLPQRALWLAEQCTLLVADVHVGKAVSFRRLGVPVPEATTTHTLTRLSQALRDSGASRLVFLGDLLHSAHAHAEATQAALARWRRSHAGVGMLLVRGNHDDRAGDPPAALDIEVVDGPWRLGPFALVHDPMEPAPGGGYRLGGHWHPAAVVGGRGFDRLRLPSFHLGRERGVLPAFGEFTGSRVLTREVGDRIFAVAGDAVVPVGEHRAPT